MRFFSVMLLLLTLCCSVVGVRAETVGEIGPTYPIAEQSALDFILKRLRDKERSGELAILQQEAIRRSMDSIKNPPAIAGLATVRERSRRVVDPTVVYKNAMYDGEGRVVVPAQTRINPLEHIRLSKVLVFFDGRDKAQVENVRKYMAKSDLLVKPILVAGSWFELSKSWKSQVYYDQNGTFVKKFGIRAVPTTVRQAGRTLILDEVPAMELAK